MRASSFVFMMLLGWRSLAAADPGKGEPAEDAAKKTDDEKKAAAKKAFDDDGCEAPTRLCLRRDGKPLNPKQDRKSLKVGESLEVRVYSTTPESEGAITLTIRAAKSLLRLTEVTHQDPIGAAMRAKVIGAAVQFTVARKAISPPATDEQDYLLVTVTLKEEDSDDARPPIKVPIVGDSHHVEFGAALFAVLGGNRVVTSPATTTADVQPSGAFVVTLFAGERPDRKINFITDPLHALALQLGTDFNLSQAVDQKEYYVGAAWSPLKGITLSGGLAIVRGQFLSAGLATPDLDDEAMPHFTERYMYRPYLGVTLTPHVIDSLKAAFGQVQGAVAR
jgi:hypothetical protein